VNTLSVPFQNKSPGFPLARHMQRGRKKNWQSQEIIMEHFYPAAPAPFDEKRSATRQKTFTAAHVHFNRGNSTYEALVRNVSTTGARLRFGDVVELPSEFEIRVSSGGNYHTAHVAWRHGLEIGVEFAA
jgi:hypothetical protein